MPSRLLQWHFFNVFFCFSGGCFCFAGKCSYIDAKSAASNQTISNGCSHRRTERCRFSWCSHEIHLSRFRVTVGRFQCTSLAMARKSVRTIRCGLHYTCANLYESSVGANGLHSCVFFWCNCNQSYICISRDMWHACVRVSDRSIHVISLSAVNKHKIWLQF